MNCKIKYHEHFPLYNYDVRSELWSFPQLSTIDLIDIVCENDCRRRLNHHYRQYTTFVFYNNDQWQTILYDHDQFNPIPTDVMDLFCRTPAFINAGMLGQANVFVQILIQ